MSPALFLCPVRPGDSNEELRYAIRSWADNITGEFDLVTVGYKPDWLNPDHHIEGNRYRSAPFAVFDNIILGSEAVSDHAEILYMNDDFFCMEPVDEITPVRRDISLEQHVDMFPRNVGMWWPRSLRLTLDWLVGEGYPHPHSYEVHRPLLASPSAMLAALHRWIDSQGGDWGDALPQWRTLYGNLNGVQAEPVRDYKLGSRPGEITSTWVSTSDQSWRRYARQIKPRFQKPSRWEI